MVLSLTWTSRATARLRLAAKVTVLEEVISVALIVLVAL